MELGGDNCPCGTQESSPSLQAQEEEGWMKADSPLGWVEQTQLCNFCLTAPPAPVYLEHINKIKQTISSTSCYQPWMGIMEPAFYEVLLLPLLGLQ